MTPPALVLVAGNPNSGKSTLFNALTGARAHVANYPGVTIDRVSAPYVTADGRHLELVDLPGTYSLSARSREEQIAVDALLGRNLPAPQAVVVVVDAAALGRALFLAIEVLATGVPVVIALNMSDEAARDGIHVDTARLAAMTGAEVVRTVATRGEGIAELGAAIGRAAARPPSDAPPLDRPTELMVDIAELEAAILAEGVLDRPVAARAWATWLLLSLDDSAADDLAGIPPRLRALTLDIRGRAAAAGRNVDLEIISSSYRRVDAIVEAVVSRPAPSRRRTDRIDSVLTHGFYGGAIFALVMMVIFQALFTWSEPAIALIESGVAAVQGLADAALPPGPFTDLVVNGIIAGVGNVVVFVPQIGLLFLFIGLLEDSGYLARVAFVIDRLMRSVGLNGRAFVPMLSGFSCAVPAVMATRTIENRTDRLLTMLVLPLMSCSARLPVYVLVTATIFTPGMRVGFLSAGAVVLFAMYMLSVVAALGAAAVLRRTVLKGPGAPLVLELPPYRLPAPRVLVFNVWQRVRAFLIGAGTVILALTIVLWALLSYPRVAAEAAGDQLRHSFAGRLGHAIEPAIEPLGFDWRIGVGIIGAFAAREVFVSTLAVVFDIESDGAEDEPLREALRAATWPDGRPLMTPLAGVSLMVFFVLACQCMSTVAVVRRESGTWRWPLFMVAYMTALAYGASLVVYQVGARLGLGLG
ncbi:MAG: ferrous iron transport protein B [Vicinamibacterales bacterium]